MSREQALDPVSVLFCCDKNYLFYLSVALVSLVEHFSSEKTLDLYIIESEISDEDKAKLADCVLPFKKRVNFNWIKADYSLFEKTGLPKHRNSYATYTRLLMADLLPQELRKIIYLDVDLVFRADLNELWEMDLHGKPLAAVNDVIGVVSVINGVQRYRELGLDPEAKYFNAGVLVIDLAFWRENNVTEKTIKYLQKYLGVFIFHDQEALNVIYYRNWFELDTAWNSQLAAKLLEQPQLDRYSYYEPRSFEEHKIIHFTNDDKVFDDLEESSLFWTYAKKLPFYIPQRKQQSSSPLRPLLRTLKSFLMHLLHGIFFRSLIFKFSRLNYVALKNDGVASGRTDRFALVVDEPLRVSAKFSELGIDQILIVKHRFVPEIQNQNIAPYKVFEAKCGFLSNFKFVRESALLSFALHGRHRWIAKITDMRAFEDFSSRVSLPALLDSLSVKDPDCVEVSGAGVVFYIRKGFQLLTHRKLTLLESDISDSCRMLN